MHAKLGHTIVPVILHQDSVPAPLLKNTCLKDMTDPQSSNSCYPWAWCQLWQNTHTTLCNPLPVPWLMLCPIPLYVRRKISALIRSQFLIPEVVQCRFLWTGTVSQELETTAQFMALLSSFIQLCRCVHLVLAYILSLLSQQLLFVLQKTSPWSFKVFKKNCPFFEVAVYNVFVILVYRLMSSRIWAFFFRKTSTSKWPQNLVTSVLLAGIHWFYQVLPIFMYKQIWNSELLVQAVLFTHKVAIFHTVILLTTFRLFHKFIRHISTAVSKKGWKTIMKLWRWYSTTVYRIGKN